MAANARLFVEPANERTSKQTNDSDPIQLSVAPRRRQLNLAESQQDGRESARIEGARMMSKLVAQIANCELRIVNRAARRSFGLEL